MKVSTAAVYLLSIFTLCAIEKAFSDTVFDTLAGELGEEIIDNGRPYLIVADIFVAAGKNTVVREGVKFLFKNFTGLQVYGTLIVIGTEKAPVVFTSENDSKYGGNSSLEPAPYDWNGITVSETATGTSFSYCIIQYSLFGINSLTEHLTVKSCMFKQNGRADLTVNGQKQIVMTNPFSYVPLSPSPSSVSSSFLSSANIRRTKSFRFSGATLLVGGAILSTWAGIEYINSSKEFDLLNDKNSLKNTRNPSIIEDWEQAKKDVNKAFTATAIGTTVLLAGGIVFFFSFF